MDINIVWVNPTKNLRNVQEYGKGMSFKNKLGEKPGMMSRQIQISMPDKINLGWKRKLAKALGGQFQTDKRAIIYVDGGHFVASARNSTEFSNRVANGILEKRRYDYQKLHIDAITEGQLHGSASLK